MLARMQYPMLVTFKTILSTYRGIDLEWKGSGSKSPDGPWSFRVWRKTAKDIQSLVTDDVLEEALRRLPNRIFRSSGEEILDLLKHRRAQLQEEATKFYKHLAKEVDVHCTNQEDFVEVQRIEQRRYRGDGFSIGEGEKVREVLFSAKISKERIPRKFGSTYIKGMIRWSFPGERHVGSKSVLLVVMALILWMIPREAVFILPISQAHNKLIKGPGSKFDPRPFDTANLSSRKHVTMSDNPLVAYRDWGRYTAPQIYPGFSSDIGLLLGGGVISTVMDFRNFPYSDSHNLKVGYATGASSGILDYIGRFPKVQFFPVWYGFRSGSPAWSSCSFMVMAMKLSRTEPTDFYKIRQRVISLFPALHYTLSPSFEIFGGLQFKYNMATDDPDTLLGQLQPYGYRNFGQVGLKLGFQLGYL